MFCGQCGNNMSDSAKFCSKCGWKVQAGQQNVQMNVEDSVPVTPVTSAPAAEKPKKKSKLWLWILLIVLVLGLGAGGTWAYFTYFASEEEDEDEDEADERDDEDEDEDKKSKKPSKKDKIADASTIGGVMDVIEVVACDPAISWYNGEIVYVQFTSDGAFYGCENNEVLAVLNNIVPATDECVSAWADGFELWAKKEPTGIVKFSTSWDYDEMADVSEPLARRFNMTSVEP